MTEHATWCTHHADSGCRSTIVLAGDAGVRLVQTRYAESRPTLMVTHSDRRADYWPCLLLPFSEAADFTALMRALGHEDIAAALEQLLTGAGAILTEEYGRQHWELPAIENVRAAFPGWDITTEADGTWTARLTAAPEDEPAPSVTTPTLAGLVAALNNYIAGGGAR